MSSNELREALRELTGEVKIAPDPYQRLMRRQRTRRRVRAAAWATAMAGGTAALLLGPIGLQGLAQPGPTSDPGLRSAPTGQGQLLTLWIKRLIGGPPRGDLVADQAFIADLTMRLMRLDYGEMRGNLVKILFAEDIGDRRIIVAARFSETHYTGMYISGARGASPVELTDSSGPDAAFITVKPMKPYLSYGYGAYDDGHGTYDGMTMDLVGVSLAPAGCELAVAQHPGEAEGEWAIAPNRDYMVWPSRVSDLDVRVTCDGVVRFEGWLVDKDNYFQTRAFDIDETVSAALRGVRGSVPRERALRLLDMFIGAHVSGPLRILYGGPVPGGQEDVYLAVNPVGSGVWQVHLMAGNDAISHFTTSDVGAKDAVVVVGGLSSMTKSLVFAPQEAVKLVVLDAAGSVVDEVELVDGIGGIDAPRRPYRLEAHDAAGRVIGTRVRHLGSTRMAHQMDTAVANWD